MEELGAVIEHKGSSIRLRSDLKEWLNEIKNKSKGMGLVVSLNSLINAAIQDKRDALAGVSKAGVFEIIDRKAKQNGSGAEE